MKKNLPKILITTGEPKGIGPEISVKAGLAVLDKCQPILIGNKTDFPDLPKELKFINVKGNSFDYLVKAVELLKTGEYSKLVTAPISKKNWQIQGVPYQAHTEALAELTNTKKYGMVFANPKAKVVLVTRHCQITQIPKYFTKNAVEDAIDLGIEFLDDLGVKNKRIGVCGFNPHAGEDGYNGKEEIEILKPVMNLPKYNSVKFIGPVSGDALFHKAVNNEIDLIIANYHDQGIFPLKAMDYFGCVNITVGLPFVRVSPGHGTAFDIAHQNKANPKPMIEAILWSLKLGKEGK